MPKDYLMGRPKRRTRPYRDPYGRNAKASVGQGRCRDRNCSILVWKDTLAKLAGYCPHCHAKNILSGKIIKATRTA